MNDGPEGVVIITVVITEMRENKLTDGQPAAVSRLWDEASENSLM